MRKIVLFFIFIGLTFFFFHIPSLYSDSRLEQRINAFLYKYELGNDYNMKVKKLLELKSLLQKLQKNKTNTRAFGIFYEKIDTLLGTLKNSYQTNTFYRIAHAGGGFDGKYYTNSLDALEYNKPFFNYFEIDFSWTTDEKMVCQHYWEDDFKKSFGVDYSGPVSYETFKKMVAENHRFKNCTLETLIDWLRENPTKYIVTDIKQENIKGLSYIAETYPEYRDNFIVQIYDTSEYEAVKSLGYRKVILTLYKYFGDLPTLLENIKGQDYFAVTMDKGKADNGWAKLISEMGFYTYTHTINTKFDFFKYKNLGIDEIYTDFLIDESGISKK